MNRENIIKEFYQLKVFLNRSNKLANETTTFGFEIQDTIASEYRLFAFVESDTEKHRIALAIRDNFCHWERSGLTNYKVFENYCANKLNQHENRQQSLKIRKLLEDQCYKLVDALSNSLKSLELAL